uniref:Uncharacterized protein n=1 Tax=Chromera velia CCMP2878 TaxID=1169474 RepID=A0A0G4H2T5_9ALVE|eukprot:Cvel_5614.t1-p1 / transcript=Cvel_5614.t1 / gene=Cvel_5614 / organism=Chromera_velia_CCMP2878 / gene_product=hypothetical protein / transcript_product=hypothetical protein / location=Cvel_scaffold264:57606-63433(-) / protein_length=614 / sequence_SO=supercontig / SO=protein_coding / is_pseudo=false
MSTVAMQPGDEGFPNAGELDAHTSPNPRMSMRQTVVGMDEVVQDPDETGGHVEDGRFTHGIERRETQVFGGGPEQPGFATGVEQQAEAQDQNTNKDLAEERLRREREANRIYIDAKNQQEIREPVTWMKMLNDFLHYNRASDNSLRVWMTMNEFFEHVDFVGDTTLCIRLIYSIVDKEVKHQSNVNGNKKVLYTLLIWDVAIAFISQILYWNRAHFFVSYIVDKKDLSIFRPVVTFSKIWKVNKVTIKTVEKVYWSYLVAARFMEDIPQTVLSVTFYFMFNNDTLVLLLACYSVIQILVTTIMLVMNYDWQSTLLQFFKTAGKDEAFSVGDHNAPPTVWGFLYNGCVSSLYVCGLFVTALCVVEGWITKVALLGVALLLMLTAISSFVMFQTAVNKKIIQRPGTKAEEEAASQRSQMIGHVGDAVKTFACCYELCCCCGNCYKRRGSADSTRHGSVDGAATGMTKEDKAELLRFSEEIADSFNLDQEFAKDAAGRQRNDDTLVELLHMNRPKAPPPHGRRPQQSLSGAGALTTADTATGGRGTPVDFQAGRPTLSRQSSGASVTGRTRGQRGQEYMSTSDRQRFLSAQRQAQENREAAARAAELQFQASNQALN